MKFSIIVVALNPGEKLKQTIDSVLRQTCEDYEIVIKDGGSTDGSVEKLGKELAGAGHIRIYTEADRGIYDAMNQAVDKARGEYLLFLNCGDVFYDEKALERAAACIERERGETPLLLYGDTYGAKNGVMIAAPQRIDGFACYRNIPCHQSCFYEAKLCREKPYNPEYRIRADYDHFLWCYYRAGAKMVHMGGTVASYEGGGYSESRENRRRDEEEHRQITEEYMSPEELARYRRAMRLTLAPVRSFLAENPFTSGIYHWLKDCLYHHKLRILAGVLLLAAELYLLLGTGIMREEAVHYHTGEGSFEVTLSDELPGLCQEFVPEYSRLHFISFLMGMEGVDIGDGTVTVLIADGDNRIVFDKTLAYAELADGYFTDVEVSLELSTRKSYYLSLIASPQGAVGYPAVSVCGKSPDLPENRTLVYGEEMPDVQLVARYSYDDVLDAKKAGKVWAICLLTALGVMLGLPDNRYVRLVAGIALLAAGPYVLGQRLELLTYKEQIYLPMAMAWNVGLMYALEALALLCTHSPRVTIALTNIALTLLYSANYYVYQFRGIPLRMNDFRAAATAAQVAGNYSFVPGGHLAMVWALLLLWVVYGVQTGGKKRGKLMKPKKRIILLSYGATIALAAGIALWGGHLLLYTDFLDEVGFADKELRGFGQNQFSDFNGYLVGTCIDVKNSRMTAPEGYSVERVEAALEQAASGQEAAAGDLPHVILIMNESFADLRVLGDLELSRENLSFFNSLQENTLRGYVNVPVYGGSTANTEFEVFTGCSMAFLPVNYYPYQQVIRKPVSSLVSRMKQSGYTAYSMHPASAGNWNRRDIYRYYGFDKCLWKEDFEGAEQIHHGVSDAETYRKIIELYENRRPDEKLFVFDLTLQNHGGYTEDEAPYAVTARGMEEPRIDQYLSLVQISDEAFAGLVDYFGNQKEKVIICMFGDHHPGIDHLVTEFLYGVQSLPYERTMDKYKTPFVIWANYDIEEAADYDISTNYLGGLLLETAGIPLSPYQAYVERLREDYPIITVNGYVDSDGNYNNWGSGGDEFMDYRMLQYNYLFDENTVEWGY